MVNRVLIRQKVVQTLYAYCQNDEGDPKMAARELSLSLSASYELYHVLLFLLAGLSGYSKQVVSKKERFSPNELHAGEKHFSDNVFLQQLSENQELSAYMESEDTNWIDDSALLKDLYAAALDSRAFSDYVTEGNYGYEASRSFVRQLYKEIFVENEHLCEVLENQNIYWESDKDLTDSFVLKTLKSFRKENGDGQKLLGQFGDPEDGQYATDLLRTSLENQSEYRGMIFIHTRGWDAKRLAMMDVVVMQVALAEILCIPDIPVKVSINEYVELAKSFGTPGSGSFVNGVLDTLVRELRESGRLDKN